MLNKGGGAGSSSAGSSGPCRQIKYKTRKKAKLFWKKLSVWQAIGHTFKSASISFSQTHGSGFSSSFVLQSRNEHLFWQPVSIICARRYGLENLWPQAAENFVGHWLINGPLSYFWPKSMSLTEGHSFFRKSIRSISASDFVSINNFELSKSYLVGT